MQVVAAVACALTGRGSCLRATAELSRRREGDRHQSSATDH